MRRLTLLTLLFSLLIMASCVKETIDFDKISGEVALQPGLVLPVAKGEVTLSDILEPNDTIVFDDGYVKILYSEEEIIEFQLTDFYNSFPSASFENTVSLASGISVMNQGDIIDIEPGDDIKIKSMMLTNSRVNYEFTSACSFEVRVDMRAPGILRDGVPLTHSITIGSGSTVSGFVDLSNCFGTLDADPLSPYNKLKLEYDVIISGTPGGFNPSDVVDLWFEFPEPEFDYVTGYFGEITEESEPEILDLGMEDLFSKLSGAIHITSPSITINYENSFGLPMLIEAEVTGRNDTEEVSLDRDPISLEYPVSIDNREISSSFTIDKDNSSLPELISMLPYEIEFYGSASINPDGETMTDNIIFGDSRLSAGIEVEVPMEFRIANIQLSDTIDFSFEEDEGEENPLDYLQEAKLMIYIENGFPLGASAVIQAYDSVSMTVLETLDTGSLLSPAPVDNDGRVSGTSEGNLEIELTDDFISAMEDAGKLIITFTLNTTDMGSKDVKIYSDYSINFRLAARVKADINLNLNSDTK